MAIKTIQLTDLFTTPPVPAASDTLYLFKGTSGTYPISNDAMQTQYQSVFPISDPCNGTSIGANFYELDNVATDAKYKIRYDPGASNSLGELQLNWGTGGFPAGNTRTGDYYLLYRTDTCASGTLCVATSLLKFTVIEEPLCTVPNPKSLCVTANSVTTSLGLDVSTGASIGIDITNLNKTTIYEGNNKPQALQYKIAFVLEFSQGGNIVGYAPLSTTSTVTLIPGGIYSATTLLNNTTDVIEYNASPTGNKQYGNQTFRVFGNTGTTNWPMANGQYTINGLGALAPIATTYKLKIYVRNEYGPYNSGPYVDVYDEFTSAASGNITSTPNAGTGGSTAICN